MRRFALVLVLALVPACTAKRAVPPPVVAKPIIVVPTERGDLIGLGIDELTQRFGQPALQVREGDSVKLQYRGSRCVLDAYLYRGPGGEGVQRVVHVDTRDRDGRQRDQRTCITELQAL